MFSKLAIQQFLGCSSEELNAILDRLRIARWYLREFTEQEARAIMAQYYFRKGRGAITGEVLGTRGGGRGWTRKPRFPPHR